MIHLKLWLIRNITLQKKKNKWQITIKKNKRKKQKKKHYEKYQNSSYDTTNIIKKISTRKI
jgi:type IV secretory pathway VirB3-like protein